MCFWWLYFDVVALVAERVLRESHGLRRTRLARDSYSYLHLPMVAGIVFAAMGLYLLVSEQHVDAGRYALDGGIALYLAGHLAFRLRNLGSTQQQPRRRIGSRVGVDPGHWRIALAGSTGPAGRAVDRVGRA